MREIQINGMTFEEIVPPQKIAEAVRCVADRINTDYAGRSPLFVCVLNGAFIFAADLFRQITLPSEIQFVRLKSYIGTKSTGIVREVLGMELKDKIRGKDIILVEDIVDTGTSMHQFRNKLLRFGANSVEISCFLFKPESLKYEDARPKYVGMNVPANFIVGYGLDLDEQARNLDAIYSLKAGPINETK